MLSMHYLHTALPSYLIGLITLFIIKAISNVTHCINQIFQIYFLPHFSQLIKEEQGGRGKKVAMFNT